MKCSLSPLALRNPALHAAGQLGLSWTGTNSMSAGPVLRYASSVRWKLSSRPVIVGTTTLSIYTSAVCPAHRSSHHLRSQGFSGSGT